MEFVATDDARRGVIGGYFESVCTDGTTKFQALRTAGSTCDPDSPIDPDADYKDWQFKGSAAGPAADWSLRHGEALRFREWAEGV